MKQVLATTLIIGFLLVDFLFFHDFFKAGENITFPQYLTGILSIFVIALAIDTLVKSRRNRSMK